MEPTDRSKVGNSQGGQTPPPVNNAQNSSPLGYDPIFSPTGMADTDKGIYKSETTPRPQPQPEQPTAPAQPQAPTGRPDIPVYHETPAQPQQTPAAQPAIISSPATPAPNHTTSTATSDIILQPTPAAPSNKSKAPLIILLIVAAIAIIAGLAILIINPFSGNNNTNTAATAASFNKFMNYLYDGSESTEVIEDAYDDSKIYKLDSILDSDDAAEREEYFTVAQRLLSDANDYFSTRSDSSITPEQLAALNDNFAFLSQVSTVYPLRYGDISSYYLGHNTNATMNYLTSYYSSLTNSTDPQIQTYGQNLLDANQTTVVYLAAGTQAGCITNSDIDAECMRSDAVLNSLPTDYSEQIAKFDTAYNVRQASVSTVLSTSWDINNAINSQEGQS